MGSRILFLGSAGDSVVVGKQYRNSGGIIFAYEENQFHIDPGPGALLMAKRASVNLRENMAVFVSKNDLIRANDVNAVVSAMTHDGLDKRGVLICPSAVAFEDKKSGPFLNKEYKKFLEKIITVENTNKIGINNIEVEMLELKNSFGFKFITPKFNLAYVPQTKYFSELPGLLKNIDVLILSVTEPKDLGKKTSLDSKYAEIILKKANPQLAIITGFGVKMLQADPLYEAREIQKNSGIQVIAAKDGMTINPVSFAATVRQKSLKGF